VAKQVFGSIETQLFLKIESVINKPLRSSTGAWMAEVDKVGKGAHMQSILARLSDEEAFRVLAAIRMDSEPKASQEKWCLLMHTRGGGTGQRDLGDSTLKERHIVSPSRRSKNGQRRSSKLGSDDGDIRFFEMERSQSRDRYDGPAPGPPAPYVSPSIQRFDMNPSYYQRTPSRPMSLLNNPLLNLAPGSMAGPGSISVSGSSATVTSQFTRSHNSVCSNFLRGECKFGLKCRYKHPVGVGLESTTSPNEEK
jgi:hypothetical protein